MKKLVLILSVLFAVVAINAQSFSVTERSPFQKYTGTAADTTISGTALNKVWSCVWDSRYLYHVVADIDEISGSATCSVILQGSMDNSNWVAIDTLTATADAVLDFDLQSGDAYHAFDWKYMRINMSLSTTGKWDLNYLYVFLTPWCNRD